MNGNVLTSLFCIVLLAFCGGLLPTSRADSTTQPDPPTGPRPDLSPDQVVRVQITALQTNDPIQNNGIRTCFKFASPGNQKMTGPVERFIGMLKSPAYRPMLNFKSAVMGPPRVLKDQAQVIVTLQRDGEEDAIYVFQLSRQLEGPLQGCWCTDGVIRVPPAATQPAPGDLPNV